jgi:excisionase family DNA binding protein
MDETPLWSAREPRPAKEVRAKRFYTVPEAAELLRVSEVTLYREIPESRFPALKIRGRYVVPAKAIDDLEQEALAATG